MPWNPGNWGEPCSADRWSRARWRPALFEQSMKLTFPGFYLPNCTADDCGVVQLMHFWSNLMEKNARGIPKIAGLLWPLWSHNIRQEIIAGPQLLSKTFPFVKVYYLWNYPRPHITSIKHSYKHHYNRNGCACVVQIVRNVPTVCPPTLLTMFTSLMRLKPQRYA